MFGRVVTFMAGGWLTMSAFAWPQSDLGCLNSCLGGVLCIAYGLLAIFVPAARYLNTAHACVVCLVSLGMEGASAAACANNVMVAAVVFGASLAPPPAPLSAPAPAAGQGLVAAAAATSAPGRTLPARAAP